MWASSYLYQWKLCTEMCDTLVYMQCIIPGSIHMCVEALDICNKILVCSQLAAKGRSAIFQRPSHSWLSGKNVMGSHHTDWSCENEEVLYKVEEERSILHAVKWRKANWIGHIWHTNCLLKHIFEGKIEGMRRWGGGGGRRRRRRQAATG